MLNLMRNSQGSDTHFLWQKKTHSEKAFPLLPDQAVAKGLKELILVYLYEFKYCQLP